MRMLKNSRAIDHDLKQIEALVSRVRQTLGRHEGDIITLAGILGTSKNNETWNENYRNTSGTATSWTTTATADAFHTGSKPNTATITHTKAAGAKKANRRGVYGKSTNMNSLSNLLSTGGVYDANAVAYKLGIKPSYARVLLCQAVVGGVAKRTSPGQYTKN